MTTREVKIIDIPYRMFTVCVVQLPSISRPFVFNFIHKIIREQKRIVCPLRVEESVKI